MFEFTWNQNKKKIIELKNLPCVTHSMRIYFLNICLPFDQWHQLNWFSRNPRTEFKQNQLIMTNLNFKKINNIYCCLILIAVTSSSAHFLYQLNIFLLPLIIGCCSINYSTTPQLFKIWKSLLVNFTRTHLVLLVITSCPLKLSLSIQVQRSWDLLTYYYPLFCWFQFQPKPSSSFPERFSAPKMAGISEQIKPKSMKIHWDTGTQYPKTFPLSTLLFWYKKKKETYQEKCMHFSLVSLLALMVESEVW